MDQTPKITLDNNCIINLLDSNSQSATSVEELLEIVRLSLSGEINIAITTRVEADLESDRDVDRKAYFLEKIRMFPVVGTIARFDVSKFDGGDVLAGKDSERIADDIQKLLFPGGLSAESASHSNKLNDIDHLVGHFINNRDIFVTDDKGILRKADQLKYSPGIVVMSPTKCLDFLNDRLDQKGKKTRHSEEAVTGSLGGRGAANDKFPDWGIRDLFFHIDKDCLEEDERGNRWERAGLQIRDKFRTEELRVWGRDYSPDASMPDEKVGPLMPIEPIYWDKGDFSYLFFGYEPTEATHTYADAPSDRPQYADLQVNKMEALKIWPVAST